jgi:hypothetical protein
LKAHTTLNISIFWGKRHEMDVPKIAQSDKWNRLSAFLKLHEIDIRQKKHDTNDKLFDAVVQELGADTITSKSVFMIVLSFYRQVQHLEPIYQLNKYYSPRARHRMLIPEPSIPDANTLQTNP